jgi:hypothetical protein
MQGSRVGRAEREEEGTGKIRLPVWEREGSWAVAHPLKPKRLRLCERKRVCEGMGGRGWHEMRGEGRGGGGG